MKVTADALLRGSAAIDRMESEVTRVVKLLFWLAGNNPRLWLHKPRLKSPHGWDFKTQFGVLAPGKAVWEVWYAIGVPHSGFRARCVYQPEEGAPVKVFSTSQKDDTLHPSGDQFIECINLEGPSSILIARDHLDVLVEGMMYEFPLDIKVKPYIEAAMRS